MASERIKGPVCGQDNCPARTYTREADGYLYCTLSGHQRAGTLATDPDEDDFTSSQGRRARKKRQREESEAQYQHYRGPKSLALYLQCLQLILRKQCWWLIHKRGRPAELEGVVQDLWTLRIRGLRGRLEKDDEEERLFSSQPTTSESGSEDEPSTAARRKSLRTVDSTPRLVDTLALCYLATQLLRLPITVADFQSWAVSQELPYIRAINDIPLSMRHRLPGQYHEALWPGTILQAEELQRVVLETVLVFQRDWGMQMPEPNVPLLLFRWVQELSLPLQVYRAVTKLASLIAVDFMWPKRTGVRLAVRDVPEVKLAALVVVATKFLYPFDGIKRYPRTNAESTSLVVDWRKWVGQRDEPDYDNTTRNLSAEKALRVTETDIPYMNGKELDDYLAWYERNWADMREEESGTNDTFQQALYKLFPLPLDASHASEEQTLRKDESAEPGDVLIRLREVQGSLESRRAISEDEAGFEETRVARPGSQSKVYREQMEVPDAARPFFEEVGKIAGVSMGTLVKAVFSVETKVKTWAEDERRGRKRTKSGHAVSGDSEADTNMSEAGPEVRMP